MRKPATLLKVARWLRGPLAPTMKKLKREVLLLVKIEAKISENGEIDFENAFKSGGTMRPEIG